MGYILVSPNGSEILGAFRLKFKASNNEAEYEALLAGVRAAKALGVSNIKILSDSLLVVSQVNGEYEATGLGMTRYLVKARNELNYFPVYELIKIPREKNTRVDMLSRLSG